MEFYNNSNTKQLHKRIELLEKKIQEQSILLKDLEELNQNLLKMLYSINEFWV